MIQIILTISLCFNFFQTIAFWLLVLSYKGTIDAHKAIDNEVDELLKEMKDKIK